MESNLLDQTQEVDVYNDAFDVTLHANGYQHNQRTSPENPNRTTEVASAKIFDDPKQTKKRTTKKKKVYGTKKSMENIGLNNNDEYTYWKIPITVKDYSLKKKNNESGESCSKIRKSQKKVVSSTTDFHEGISESLKNVQLSRSKSDFSKDQNKFDDPEENTLISCTKLQHSGMKSNGVVPNVNYPSRMLCGGFSTEIDIPEPNSEFISTVSSSRLSYRRRSATRIILSSGGSTLTGDPTGSEIDDTRKTSKIQRDTFIKTEKDLIGSAKNIILKRCQQSSYLPFNICFPESFIDRCSKIGEGTYGEVFLYKMGKKISVIKIVPVEGHCLVNGEPQKKFHEILSEIIIAEELHKLRFGIEHNTSSFVGVKKIMCVIGKYPEKFIDLWEKYAFEKISGNDCPSRFGSKQLYIIFELAHGGQDFAEYTFYDAIESFSVFLQTAMALAVAERSLEFEHRDLHCGNILISKTDDTSFNYKLDGNDISLDAKGVKVVLIDFTFSRMTYQGCKIFNDMSQDPLLFDAMGDYQFDIYRMMRDRIDDDWQQFCPYTNILWLDFVLYKMITSVSYQRKTTKIHKTAIKNMEEVRNEILNYKSVFDFVCNCKRITTHLTS